MTVSKYATQAGKRYETELLGYLREFGHDVERLRLTGKEDEGDLLFRPYWQTARVTHGPGRYVIEAKRTKSLDLAGWVKEAQVEAEHYAKHRDLLTPPGFLVVHKARNKSLGQSYVTTTLEEWLSWL